MNARKKKKVPCRVITRKLTARGQVVEFDRTNVIVGRLSNIFWFIFFFFNHSFSFFLYLWVTRSTSELLCARPQIKVNNIKAMKNEQKSSQQVLIRRKINNKMKKWKINHPFILFLRQIFFVLGQLAAAV